jgi:hypothetical protein
MKKILTTIMSLAVIACAHVPETMLAESAFQEPTDPAEHNLYKTASYDKAEEDPAFEAIDLNNIQFLVAVLQNGTPEDKQLVFCNFGYSSTQQWTILPTVRKAAVKKAGNNPKKLKNIPEMLGNYGAVLYCKGFKAKYPDLTRKLGKDFLQMVGNIPIYNGAKGAAGAKGYYYLEKF